MGFICIHILSIACLNEKIKEGDAEKARGYNAINASPGALQAGRNRRGDFFDLPARCNAWMGLRTAGLCMFFGGSGCKGN
jgi:hypothetical protein